MTRQDFLENMQDILKADTELSWDTSLFDLDTWDSLALLATVDLIEGECGITLDVTDFKKFETLGDIFARVSKNED